MFVYNCLNHFNSFIAPELIIIENNRLGNRMHLFVTKNFHLQVDLLKKVLHIRIASNHYYKHIWYVENKFIHCYAVNKLQN